MLDRFARFSLAISNIHRCWHKLAAEEMAKYGLNSPHAIYLNTLHCYPEGITAAKLCKLCGKDKADVSRMISILENKGLVCKNIAFSTKQSIINIKEGFLWKTTQELCENIPIWVFAIQ